VCRLGICIDLDLDTDEAGPSHWQGDDRQDCSGKAPSDDDGKYSVFYRRLGIQ
jgi:hypothetical protein